MRKTSKSFRTHIGIFGRRNSGKSTILNSIVGQEVSIISPVAGTTTDPVEKPMELNPLGAVLFIDTAGIDDDGSLGIERVRKTEKIYRRVDIGIIVTDNKFGEYEEKIYKELSKLEIPVVLAFNKSDISIVSYETIEKLKNKKMIIVKTSAKKKIGIEKLKEAIVNSQPNNKKNEPKLIADLVGAGEVVILVIPIDKEAPKGRLILAQVQTIRELLDSNSITMIVQEDELSEALNSLKKPPKLVVTDSQAIRSVDKLVPQEIKLTTFSILFSRLKGDLLEQTKGTLIIDSLKNGDKILVAETCSHRHICDDIGRVKLPNWLNKFVGGKLEFTTVVGHDFPDDLSSYKLIIHCGACMTNRKELMNRISQCKEKSIPITNYGLVISKSLGVLERVVSPFPEVKEILGSKL